MNLADLRKPFPPAKISWRIGSVTKDQSKGMALAYLDARDVQDRLDEVCGPDGWQNRFPHVGAKTVCEIGIRISRPTGEPHLITAPCEWIWKSDGAGDSDIEAEKGALSDAFKRAAVKWGIGRYLYDLESPWVALDGKKIAAHEYKRLEALLAGKMQTAQATAIHNSPTMPTQPEGPDEDTIKGSQNWVDQEKPNITACTRLPEMYMWLDENGESWTKPTTGSHLYRLKKSPKHFEEIKAFYLARMAEINK